VGLSDVIESGVGDYHDNQTTLVAILHAVPPEMQAGLVVKPTATEAYQAIYKVRIDANRVKEANAKRLCHDFADIVFNPGETVIDFSIHLNTGASELRVLGDDITDKQVIKKMLHVVPDRLKQVAILMETLLDLDSLSIEEAVEQRKTKSSPKEAGGRLLLTEEEWMARMKSWDGSGSNTGAKNGGGNKGGGKNKRGKSSVGGEQKTKASRDDVWRYCGKKGHWAQECHKNKQDKEAHLAQGAEEEQSLLMAHSVVLNLRPPPTLTPASPLQKVFTDLEPEEEHVCGKWVLDSGAMNYMTGAKELFAELDTQIYGTIKFGDGSMTKIGGHDTIILTCKSSKHRTLSGVYYVPRLKASIISIGQVDEAGCHVNIDGGVLCIYDQHGQLLTKVARDESSLYYLDLKVGCLVCLAARATEVAWQWHTRFGHLIFSSLRKMAVKNMVHGLLVLDHVDQVCDGRLVGKQRCTSFQRGHDAE
jgi:hypothetical protein